MIMSLWEVNGVPLVLSVGRVGREEDRDAPGQDRVQHGPPGESSCPVVACRTSLLLESESTSGTREGGRRQRRRGFWRWARRKEESAAF